MKELIMDIRPWNKELVTMALESSVEKIIIPKDKTEEAHKLGRVITIAEDGDMVLGKDIIEVEYIDQKDEENISSQKIPVIVATKEWKIIPLENLVSKNESIFTTCSVKEIKTMLGVLEKGVKGVVIKPSSVQDIKDAAKVMNDRRSDVELIEAIITKVKPVGSGERSCIDTCTTMVPGEGMLVGNSSNFLFLVQSESIESSYCATRPFRVNAGAIHSYCMLNGNKTKYLSEVSSGDEVLVVNNKGKTKISIVGRNKREERPLILVEAKADDVISGVILQNAETIRLVKPDGTYISMSELKEGDKVLVRKDDTGRHFGQAIKETITE